MADTKISALPASTTPLAGTEVLPIVQSGTTKQVSVANLTAGRAISATELTLTAGNVIVASGQGIDFSATPGTGTSELLDDYEEGSWTPSVGGDATYFHNYGSYVKVGRQVTVTGFLYVNAIGTGSTTTLSGLPFTSENTYQKGCLSIGEVANLAVNVTSLQGQIAAIASTISFFGFTAAASGNTPAVAIFQNQTVLYFAATYIASA
jgi:hypothetical protein